ncbi:LARGE xylosyl- and glucuronyltransferase 2 isoform X2 [Cephus cinctus]|uniref:LARGE xylosyl- and glucuronyltransferase 2 isoform X2 n=1 Tax=Cephus cinctus TaxID=211228 RepID=A0AAJ7W5F8_CEPCN|nr:LARGE xylosyl- and glucuronyltransferase 2 isoform X2 [Cephus cinctus]
MVLQFFRNTSIIPRIAKHVCHIIMVRPWIGCLFGILIASVISYLYILINVSSLDNKYIEDLGKLQDFTHDNRLNFIVNISNGAAKVDQVNVSLNNDRIKEKCESIHIAIVCAGYNSTFSLATVVKSIVFYRTKPLHFHLIVDEIAKRTLKILFRTWNLPHVTVTFYKAEEWIPGVAWIPNKHYSGVYGLLKLILPAALHEDKVLVLDTDVTVLTDIAKLWQLFHEFNNDHWIGLVENQSDWYIKQLSYRLNPWPALGRGFNTGVMLMHLQRLRDRDFYQLWKNITINVLRTIPETHLADQDILNAVIKEYPSIIQRLTCTWNIQLSDHTISERCYSNTNEINIIHWNSPRKQAVRNKHIDDFRNMYKVFLELDGNLLRRRLFGCDETEVTTIYDRSNMCLKFTKAATIRYRTHLFLLEYEHNVYSAVDVALVTQCSVDRISLLEDLSKYWPGTISVALYLTDAETHSFLDFVHASTELSNRKNIAYHIVYKESEFYPINYLRNIAMSYVSTPYIFQLDIDFLPQFGLYQNLMNYITKLNISVLDKTALVVPAFETQRYRFSFPVNKEELVKSLNRGQIYTFRYHVWTQGHAATNYTFWRNATEPYAISWEPDFEPYIVVSNLAPQYDIRFIGFGWNKVSYLTHLTALGYTYIVLPDVFIIHRPHAPSVDIGKFRTDALYRRCLKKLKDMFVEELLSKYGDSNISQLRKKPVSIANANNDQRNGS